MVKKNRNRNRNQNQHRSQKSPSTPSTVQRASSGGNAVTTPPEDRRVQEIKHAGDEAAKLATEEDLSAITSDARPTVTDLDSLWTTVREARDIFRSATKRSEEASRQAEVAQREFEQRLSGLEERERDMVDRTEALDGHQRELKERQGMFDQLEVDVAGREAEVVKLKQELLEKETALRKREINAEAGFMNEREQMLASLEESLGKLRKALTDTEKEIADRRKAGLAEEVAAREKLQIELERLRDDFHTEQAEAAEANAKGFDQRNQELDQREATLEAQRRALECEKRRLSFDKQDLEEYRANLDQRVELRAAAVREELEHHIHSLEEQLSQARKDRDIHEALLRKREEADRLFGQRTPEEVLEELNALRSEKQELKRLLAERPDADAAERLDQLEKEKDAWYAERSDLRRQVSELKRRVAYLDADANEREVQRDVLTSLESQRLLLFEANRQLRAEIDELLSRNDARSPFPACVAMDDDAELQSAGPMCSDIDSLESFVGDLQHRIAHDPENKERKLYYTLPDLRSFLGGLAMSRLLLLQGISGTGKTSLAMAFARAVGNPATVIEVQAGWRDPQDLVGYYNVFEKRFYEGEFLKAIYRAHTPRWADAIHIVLLDEMNLSHPEQYFSDLLSALELEPEKRRLVLMSHAVESAPERFTEGSKLAIPSNVWFVGTANHDETTKEFADKTYDRSHVMEFPPRPEPFNIEKPGPRLPISFFALEKAFESAIRHRRTHANKAVQFLEDTVRDSLANHFGVGWGPRLERQIRRYVPVVVAAGGSVGEATDHVLSMRLLRKLKNRHDNRPEHLEALRQRIEESWPGLDKKQDPVRSLQVIKGELRRLGRASEDAA